MILKSAINDFLDAPRDNHDWMKDLTHRELDDAIFALRPRPWMPECFDEHQKVGFLLGVAYPQFCFWYDMGTGKTLLDLVLARYKFDCGRTTKGIVIAKNDEAIDGWAEQMEEWKVELPQLPLFSGSSKSKWRALSEFERGLIYVSYPGLRAMVSKREAKESKDEAKSNRKELVKVPKQIKLLCKDVGVSIWDESTEIGHTTSLNYAVARTVCKLTPSRYGLAGQPFGRDPEMLWAQHHLIDGGVSLGPTLGLFREAMYNKKKNFFGGPYSFTYKFREDMRPELNRMCKHRSISYDESECGDLPELRKEVIKVHFPTATSVYYEEQMKRLRAARGNFREMKNAFTMMRQISSGFLGVTDDETGEKVQIEFPVNPKLDKILDRSEEVPLGRKFLIFYEFTHSGRKLFEALKKKKFNPVWLWGGNDESRRDVEKLKHDEETDCAVINWKKGAYSLNFQRANYMFVYESPVGVIDRRQMQKRIHRKGQEWTCFLDDFVTAGTMDERILRFHAEGFELFEAILRDPDPDLIAA